MANSMPMPKIKRDMDPLTPAAVLTQADVTEIGRLLHKNLSMHQSSNDIKEALVAAIRDLATMSVEGTEITLEPRLLRRLRSRCLKGNDFPAWLKEVVVKQLHDYAGW